MGTDTNRLNVLLAEKTRTNRWLWKRPYVNPSTVSKGCTNSSQPDIETLIKTSKLLGVEMEELLNKRYVESIKI